MTQEGWAPPAPERVVTLNGHYVISKHASQARVSQARSVEGGWVSLKLEGYYSAVWAMLTWASEGTSVPAAFYPLPSLGSCPLWNVTSWNVLLQRTQRLPHHSRFIPDRDPFTFLTFYFFRFRYFSRFRQISVIPQNRNAPPENNKPPQSLWWLSRLLPTGSSYPLPNCSSSLPGSGDCRAGQPHSYPHQTAPRSLAASLGL